MILDLGFSWEEYVFKMILPLVISVLMAFFVGLERQNVGKAAGVSSHILVSLSATGIAIMQRFMFESSHTGDGQRLIAQVVTGIGFIGAGVIIKDQSNVIRGITTAATIWSCAMVGILVGSGYIILGGTIAIFIVVFIIIRDLHRGINPFKKQSHHVEDQH